MFVVEQRYVKYRTFTFYLYSNLALCHVYLEPANRVLDCSGADWRVGVAWNFQVSHSPWQLKGWLYTMRAPASLLVFYSA